MKRVDEFLFAMARAFTRSMAHRGGRGMSGKDEKMGSGLARGCRSSVPCDQLLRRSFHDDANVTKTRERLGD